MRSVGITTSVRHHARSLAAVFDPADGLVLLQHQDRSRWDRDAIADAVGLLTRAARQHCPVPTSGRHRGQPREAERWEDTEWEQIVLLYDMLLLLAPLPVTRLHRAIALRYPAGPRVTTADLDALAGALDHRHLYHATRAELLRELGEHERADRRALDLTSNPAERAVLQRRITWP